MPGRGQELKGTIKEAAGKTLGNERMAAEGKADRATGKAVRETAGAGNLAAGSIKRGAGKALGNERLQGEGTVQRLKGKVQRAG
jgi:uncharacterized protein YjbJ (UPF0337 family)